MLFFDIEMAKLSDAEFLGDLRGRDHPITSVPVVTSQDEPAIADCEQHTSDRVLNPLSSDRFGEPPSVVLRRTAGWRTACFIEALLQLQMPAQRESSRIV